MTASSVGPSDAMQCNLVQHEVVHVEENRGKLTCESLIFATCEWCTDSFWDFEIPCLLGQVVYSRIQSPTRIISSLIGAAHRLFPSARSSFPKFSPLLMCRGQVPNTALVSAGINDLAMRSSFDFQHSFLD